LLDDLQRCEQLGIGLYNLHPGSTLGTDKDVAISQIANTINDVLLQTSFVKIVLENMTGQDRIVGSNLNDLRDIINRVNNKDRIGVCIDTCHSFSAGYDLRTETAFDTFWELFDDTIGYKYLSGMHLNDSKYPFDSKRDVHQNIGFGFLGLETFRLIMNKQQLQGIPLILETPQDEGQPDSRGTEIELLKWLEGKSKDDPEMIAKANDLQAKGAQERDKCQQEIDRKMQKMIEKATKTTRKRKVVHAEGEMITKKRTPAYENSNGTHSP
jgi:AP endonuclease-1